MSIIFVATGGAIGAVLRYIISLIPVKAEFPILTLATNLVGAVSMGFVVGMFGKGKISNNMSLFLKTGLCGGFTTFSTFSLESLNLLEQGKIAIGCTYMALSLVLCICGVLLGKYISILMFKNI